MRAGFLALFFLTAAADAALASGPLRAVPGDARDIVLFLDARPYLIRLHLQVEGRSFQESWEGTIGQLFRYLDVDGDGVLSKKEAALAPSITQWVQLMNGMTVEPDAAPDFAALAGGPTETKVTREHFLSYYLHSPAGALQIEWGWRQMMQNRQMKQEAQDLLTDALFKQLDKDKDGALSREELLAAPETLHPLDTDGDEIIRAFELSPAGAYPAFTFRSPTDAQPAPKNFPFAVLTPGKPIAALTRELLAYYDKDKNGKLSRKELPLGKAEFDRLDGNRDGELDAAELNGWLDGWRKLPPELELVVPLERHSRRDILVMPTGAGKPRSLATRMPPGDGPLRIPVDEKQLEVARRNGVSSLRQELLRQFDGLAGKKGVVAEKAILQPPFTFVALLRLADRDGDNSLSRKEIDEFLNMQEKFFFRATYLTVMDRGVSLFELLDADHDGQLSPRELRSAWTRLAPWDRGGTGRIRREQLPRQFQFVLSHGWSRAGSTPSGGFGGLPPFRDRSRGPLWFRKMDRNGDGDVSRREFLGTAEQFRRIDADGDGLIDVSEAERADRELRKKRP